MFKKWECQPGELQIMSKLSHQNKSIIIRNSLAWIHFSSLDHRRWRQKQVEMSKQEFPRLLFEVGWKGWERMKILTT